MTKVVEAAGGVVWRPYESATKKRTGGIQVLLVHRPKYKDWTFPKGKAENGEPIQVTAMREIAEETGVTVRLGHPLPEVNYRIRGGIKRVRYWCARPLDEVDFLPNKEIDKVRWVSIREAHKKLTYDHDVRLLEAFEDLVSAKKHKTKTLILLRHAKAMSRSDFAKDSSTSRNDLERPLTARGAEQASELVDTLKAFGVRRIISSPALRCVDTVTPYADKADLDIETDERLVEGSAADDVVAAIRDATHGRAPVLVCSHRPTFPEIHAALGLVGPALPPAGVFVLHLRKGRILMTEMV